MIDLIKIFLSYQQLLLDLDFPKIIQIFSKNQF